MSNTLLAGTPLWRESTAKAPAKLGAALTHPVFMGVTILHSILDDRPVPMTATGDQGVILVLVKGPAAIGDVVGYKAGTVAHWLVKDGTPGVGTMLEDNADTSGPLLCRVRLGTGAGSRIRLLLCDGATGGDPKYYLVTAELDPDQTP